MLGAADDHQFFLQIHHHKHFRIGAVLRRVGQEHRGMQHGKLRTVIGHFRLRRRPHEQGAGKQRRPGELSHDPHRHAVIGMLADKQIFCNQIFLLEVI